MTVFLDKTDPKDFGDFRVARYAAALIGWPIRNTMSLSQTESNMTKEFSRGKIVTKVIKQKNQEKMLKDWHCSMVWRGFDFS